MIKKNLILILLLSLFTSFKADKQPYSLFNKEGKKVKYSKMLKELEKADIVLFGELHNNPLVHWLQLEVTQDLFQGKESNLILGGEMFESDNQLILNEYIDSLISTKSFEDEMRLWPNYKTDYKPLIEFACENKVRFVASNIPRRYASLVNSKGFEGLDELSDEAKSFIAPLPIEYDPELSSYKNMLSMEGLGTHITENLPKAQAVKDATMAYFIMESWSPGKLLLHFHGTYHSDNFESIYWYLKQKDSKLNVVTISTVSQNDISALTDDNLGKADFTICVDSDMTQTR